MTNLQKFAAQRLTKNQMNDIRGGAAPAGNGAIDNCGTLYYCTWGTNVGDSTYVCEDELGKLLKQAGGFLICNPV